jgi:hypothetical protein
MHQVYSPEVDAWAYGPKMHDRRFTTGAAALGGALYAAGGFDGVQYLATCERLDPRTPSWQLASPCLLHAQQLALWKIPAE